MPFDSGQYPDDELRGLRNKQRETKTKSSDRVPLRDPRRLDDPNYKSIPFGERRRLIKKQRESSAEFVKHDWQKKRRVLKSAQHRISDTVKKISAKAKAILAISLTMEWLPWVWVVQLFGWALLIIGFGLLGIIKEGGDTWLGKAASFAVSHAPAGSLVSSAIGDTAAILPLSFFWIGYTIALLMGLLTMGGVLATFVSRRVKCLHTISHLISFAFSLGLYFIGFLSLVPWVIIWMCVVVWTAGNKE